MNESELHEHIYKRSQSICTHEQNQILVGPGDDCAVLQGGDGRVELLTVDQLVEGRHFLSDTPIDLIARKAVGRSVSDIAAMGGQPSWALGTGVLPHGYQHADALFDAMHRWANHWGCPLIGGDIATHSDANHPLTLSVTVGGLMQEGVKPVCRSGAQPGDLVYVTGKLGDSFASGRHLQVQPQLSIGQWASSIGAHAMMDISDGLGRDVYRIARASNVYIEINAQAIPMHEGCRDWQQAASEGEDYELLIVLDRNIDIQKAPLQTLVQVGVVQECADGEEPSVFIIDELHRHDASTMGWDH